MRYDLVAIPNVRNGSKADMSNIKVRGEEVAGGCEPADGRRAYIIASNVNGLSTTG